jgi:GDP-4-dehydro-6-deoxy-D-mannose reductase
MSSGPILVTGATGFVGRHVVAAATAQGLEVVATEGDLRDTAVARDAVERHRPRAVIHVAARPRRMTDVWETLADEIRMAGNVLNATQGTGAAVLIPGSAGQYGLSGDQALAEDAPAAPVSAYGALKCVLEDACLSAPLRGDARVIWARSFNIVGPGQGLDAPVPAWARQIADLERAGGGVLRTGSLTPVRDFLDVRDVAEAFLDLIGRDIDGVVNVASGEGVALQTVVDELVGGASVPIEAQADPALARRVDPPRVVADVTRLHRLTDWRPRFSLEQSLGDVLAEWRAATPAEAR